MLLRSAETRSSRWNCLAEPSSGEDGIAPHHSLNSPAYIITDHEILVWEMYDMVLKKKNESRTQ